MTPLARDADVCAALQRTGDHEAAAAMGISRTSIGIYLLPFRLAVATVAT